jgi:hypothetical protein
VVARPAAGDGRSFRILVATSIVAIVAIEALYLAIVTNQGGPPPDTTWITPFVAGFLAVAAVLMLVWLAISGPLRAGLLGSASGGLLLMGVLSAFSIGVPVLIAAALSTAGLVLTVRRRPVAKTIVSAIAGIVVSVGLLVGGFQVAWQRIEGPATGQSGGTTASFIGPGESYRFRLSGARPAHHRGSIRSAATKRAESSSA